MSASSVHEAEETGNPLDLVEDLVEANQWPSERSGDDEMMIEIPGRWCGYRLFFLWQDEFSALQFCCRTDVQMPEDQRLVMADLLTLVNERLWLGHFDMASDDLTPMFRYTSLLRGIPSASPELIEDLIEIAVIESDRYYPAFAAVAGGAKAADLALEAAVLDPVGEA